MNNKQFFKEQLNKIVKLKKRNNNMQDAVEKNIESDFHFNLLSDACEPYETIAISSISRLWTEYRLIDDWIDYLLYECTEDSIDNVSVYDRKYSINSVDSLCDFLDKEYKMIGEQ